jgi:hypothetical protein
MSISAASVAFSTTAAPAHRPAPPGATDKPAPKDFTHALQASLLRGANPGPKPQ